MSQVLKITNQCVAFSITMPTAMSDATRKFHTRTDSERTGITFGLDTVMTNAASVGGGYCMIRTLRETCSCA